MSNKSDFVIENGVLEKYKGPGGDVVIPEGVTSIRRYAFWGCGNLTSVVIPDSVTSIGENAFWGCSSLTSVVIPEGVTSIGDWAFEYCRSLTSVVIPEGVTSIGSSAFEDCRSLTSVVIPEGVTSIGSSAFRGCSSLTNVVIPEGVTSIGENAFENCRSLMSVDIPEGVTSIGYRAFDSCSSLTSLDIPEGVTSIGNSAFSGCKGLADNQGLVITCGILFDYFGDGGCVVIPEGVTSIGNWAFENCRSLMSVVIPEGVTSIGEKAFWGCSSLTSVVIPEGVTSIGNSAFSGCRSLTSVVIPEGVTSIGNWAFENCRSLMSVVIPEGVTSIGNEVFRGCKGLADNQGFVIVRGIVYDYCGDATSVVIPDSVTSIGKSAFYRCSSLTSVVISEGVTSIGDGAFSSCSSLTSVVIPEGVTSIGSSAFHDCSSLTSVSIPEGVTSIGSSAFHDCSSLTSVVIPEGVTSIGNGAFKGCSSLTSVVIPEGVTSIGNGAFKGCSSLTSVVIPEGVTSIGDRAFKDCTALQMVSLKCGDLSMVSYQRFGKTNFALVLGEGENTAFYAFAAKAECDNLTDFVRSGKWRDYDLELINNGPVYRYRMPARLLGSLGRLLNPTELTDENRALYVQLLQKNAKKLVPVAEALVCPEIITGLISLGILENKTLTALRKLLAASAVPEIAALADLEVFAVKAQQSKKPAEKKAAQKKTKAEQNPLQKEYAEKLKNIKGNERIRKMKLVGVSMPVVLLQDGTAAPEELFRFLLASYGSQVDSGYHFDPAADEAAALLRYDSLCDAMEVVSGKLDGPRYPAVLPLLCRYGNARQIHALIKAWRDWGNWKKYNNRGYTAQEVLLDALILSDTREAAIWLEKNSNLEQYAALRGKTVAEIYDEHLFDFGFDETGKRTFDLGVTTIEVTLTQELKLSLYNTATNKAVKMIPKKGVDPVVQKKAADELTDMRQTLKRAVKIKLNQLFEGYINGTEYTAESWEKSYFGNLFLKRVGQILVWSQAGTTFLMTDNGMIDSAGQPYALTHKPIKVAHPMEMASDDVAAWQSYFSAHGLKQPFAQIWEPVYDQNEFREDRYKGCAIRVVYLKSQQRLGISAEWSDDEYWGHKYVWIEGFDVKADDALSDDKDPDEREGYLQITSLKPEKWNRRTNAVLAYLDRITVWDRVKKDDISVMELMGKFTLAQITEFIKTAQEANAVNVLAELLEYKNTHFADFDPMEEFTLEW